MGRAVEDGWFEVSLFFAILIATSPLHPKLLKLRHPSHGQVLSLTPSHRPETMRVTLAMIREDYGGAEEYLRRAGITDEEIEALREALLVPA